MHVLQNIPDMTGHPKFDRTSSHTDDWYTLAPARNCGHTEDFVVFFVYSAPFSAANLPETISIPAARGCAKPFLYRRPRICEADGRPSRHLCNDGRGADVAG